MDSPGFAETAGGAVTSRVVAGTPEGHERTEHLGTGKRQWNLYSITKPYPSQWKS